MICFMAAWVTDLIGVHPIFGAFVAGAIMPRTNNFHVQIIEKIEDINSFVLLPLYFASSGLKTNIGLLNTGIAWAAVFLVIICACAGKIIGASCGALILGFNYREAFAVGTLMNAKGLVELIVLNIGLNANILSPTLFTIMVLMALITTFMTTPLLRVIWPPKMRKTFTEEKSLEENSPQIDRSILLCIPPTDPIPLKPIKSLVSSTKNFIAIHAARMIVVTDRDSSVLIAAREVSSTVRSVEVLKLDDLAVTSKVKIISHRVVSTPANFSQDLLSTITVGKYSHVILPYDYKTDRHSDDFSVNNVVNNLFGHSPCPLLVFSRSDTIPHYSSDNLNILALFGGGPDDCAALEYLLSLDVPFVLFLCKGKFKEKKKKKRKNNKKIKRG